MMLLPNTTSNWTNFCRELCAIPGWQHHHHRDRHITGFSPDVCRQEPHQHQGEPVENRDMSLVMLYWPWNIFKLQQHNNWFLATIFQAEWHPWHQSCQINIIMTSVNVRLNYLYLHYISTISVNTVKQDPLIMSKFTITSNWQQTGVCRFIQHVSQWFSI